MKKITVTVIFLLVFTTCGAFAEEKTAKSCLEQGMARYDKKDTENALKSFREAIKIDPNFAQAYYSIAVIFDEQKKIDEALSYYEKTLKADPNYAKAYFNIATLYELRRQPAKAVKKYESFLKTTTRSDIYTEFAKEKIKELQTNQ